jgi:hypothetical protein
MSNDAAKVAASDESEEVLNMKDARIQLVLLVGRHRWLRRAFARTGEPKHDDAIVFGGDA